MAGVSNKDVASKIAARSLGRGKPSPTLVLERRVYSIPELLEELGDAFPNNSELDSYLYPSCLTALDAGKLANKYGINSPFEIVLPEPGDRTCNWSPEDLFVYEDAIKSGLRFPIHDFIIRLLAEIRINPCQLPPNSWKAILCFMALCLQKGYPLSIPLFRSIFLVRNSASSQPGWVHIQHRPGVPQIFDFFSTPEKNPNWRRKFVIVRWRGGDWGKYFRSQFCKVKDPGKFDKMLLPSEISQRDELCTDNGHTHYRAIIKESILRAIGLSSVSEEAAAIIDAELGVGGPDEVTRRSALRLNKEANPPEPLVPNFLTHSLNADKKRRGPESLPMAAFKPGWGICDHDSIGGDSTLAAEWSKHGIPLADQVNLVLRKDMIDETEVQGAHAIFMANAYFQSLIHQSKDLRDSEQRIKKENKRLIKEKGALEERILTAEKGLSELRAENQKLVMERARAIDDYMESEDFLAFIDNHDDRVYPGVFTKGWDQALSSVIAQHPGLFDPAVDFKSPYSVVSASSSVVQNENPVVDVEENEETQDQEVEE